MKEKIIFLCISLSTIAGVAYAANEIESIKAFVNHNIKITVNGNPFSPKDSEGIELAPVIINGNSYLPAKAIGEALGATVQWNEPSKTIIITNNVIGNKPTDKEVSDKVNEIKKILKVGMTQAEVKSLLKESYKIVDDNGDLENGSDSYWKYNYFTAPGYTHDDLPDHVIDEEGLKARNIGLSLFVGWKKEKIHLFTISYVRGNDLYLFIMNPDGTYSESKI
ncbi:stalk domain-containing protein [Paenibacillus filicis]|uniref:Stalk domain-containing protein n=1 Tax=Paenibacillus filicis TaxID=669464 RepID=A0ABU9DIT7_9BACL